MQIDFYLIFADANRNRVCRIICRLLTRNFVVFFFFFSELTCNDEHDFCLVL